ncbi:transglutaminase-like domain-containing protein [Reyranella sp.]|uniref:transglutaminase-like domain-containing protein n=1 Tax=Reyranella sp. TaxID=1929291 RepID=UPI003BAB4A7C
MTLDDYRAPVGMTDPGARAGLLDGLPADVATLAGIVQGVLIHEHVAPAYGVTLTPPQHAQAHQRGIATVLDCIARQDSRALPQARPAGERVVGVCRHFTLLHVAMLRRQGVAARARCGFGAYFQKGRFIDHWVTEYWSAGEDRWILVDAQLDRQQRDLFGVTFDPLDVPRDQFLVAGDAWRLCRDGAADPATFGVLDMYGLWFVASNVIRDVAALNNREMLPWDVWGAMTANDAEIDRAFIDGLADLSRAPDGQDEALRAAYEDPRVAVPGTVFNAVLQRPEPVG